MFPEVFSIFSVSEPKVKPIAAGMFILAPAFKLISPVPFADKSKLSLDLDVVMWLSVIVIALSMSNVPDTFAPVVVTLSLSVTVLE